MKRKGCLMSLDCGVFCFLGSFLDCILDSSSSHLLRRGRVRRAPAIIGTAVALVPAILNEREGYALLENESLVQTYPILACPPPKPSLLLCQRCCCCCLLAGFEEENLIDLPSGIDNCRRCRCKSDGTPNKADESKFAGAIGVCDVQLPSNGRWWWIEKG